MSTQIYPETPKQTHYDVVIAGGAIIGSSIAWFLSSNPDFDGSLLVIERDPSYEFASTRAPIPVSASNFQAKLIFAFHNSPLNM